MFIAVYWHIVQCTGYKAVCVLNVRLKRCEQFKAVVALTSWVTKSDYLPHDDCSLFPFVCPQWTARLTLRTFLKVHIRDEFSCKNNILGFSRTVLALGTDTSHEDVHKFMIISLRDWFYWLRQTALFVRCRLRPKNELTIWTLSLGLQVSSLFVCLFHNVVCILSSLMHASFPSHPILHGSQHEKLACACFLVFTAV